MNAYTDQMKTTALDLYKESNIEIMYVPAIMIKPLDVAVNRYVK